MAQLPESFRNLKNLESLTFSGIPYLFYAFKKGVMVSKRHFLNWCTQKLNGAHSMSTFTFEEKIEMFNSCQKDSSDVLTHRGVNQLNNHLFWKVPRLGTADKSAADPYGCVPPQIFSCRRLTSLVLSFQGIRFLPDDFNKLRHLRKIILDHCRMLQTVSAEVGKLPLQVLAMGQCRKLQTPPPEVLKQGMAYTLYYMKKLAAGSQACYRTKLMFVGLGGAGKTSLMRSLMSGDLKSPPIGSEGITDGIDIKSWVINRENQALTYSVWDFAGQTVYYNTHQFFLTSRAIYFLTWNSRLGFEHAGLEFWLSSIQCHAPYAPVFVVGTHADQVSKSDLPRDDLKRNYPSIAGFYSISSLTGVGIRQLLDDLFHVTLKQPYIGERVPEVWIKMERAIARDRDNKCNLLSWEEIRDLAGKYDLDESETKQAVKFLHDLGSLQHFDNQSLKNKVVINPQWIVDVMACVVSVHNSCIKEGRLRYEDISKIWSDYPADLHDWLLSLTEAFDLTFPLPDQKVNIVPCLLPQGQPEFAWPEMQPGDGTRQAKILYRFDILPAGLFNRVQVRLYQISDSSSMWKRGSLLRKNDHIGLMIMRGGSEVLVKAQGVRPENIIFLVHEVFESVIFEFFKGVSYEYLIPCLDCMKNACENATMFSSTILRRAIMLKAPFIQCHSSFHSLPISDVQGCMPPEMSDDFNLQFHMTMKDLDRMHDSFSYDCGFIYCQADVPQEGSEAIHPIRLVKDLQTMENGYKCWHNEDLQSLPLNDVLKNIGDCKCIILFISSNFTRDDFCGKIFRFVYDILKKPVLLVTLGQGHQWRESDIGIKITHKVYINMQKSWLYNAKLVALEKQIRSIVRSDRVQHRCDVFISYSWLNSIAAIQAGHVTRKENAMGFGDPREIKEFLEKNGVTCWIDIEKTGVDGLFEEIAQGLKQCKVMVACISNEYALSSNCQMEFRFAAVTLKMPIVLAVVGTGYAWESTEIGLLSLGHDKSNFQINNSECYDQLLRDVREKLSLVDQPEEIISNPGQPHGFRELYELAQRKFMRQFSGYAENGHEYPRLFVVDTVAPSKADDKTSVKDAEALELEIADVSQEGEAVIKDATDFCFRILCEYEEGWHVCHDGFPINMVGSELSQLWKTSAPYFGRMLKLLKHSNIDLNCFGTLDGDLLIDTLETNVGVNVDLKPIYQEIREHIIRKDYEMTYGGLKLCYLPNGKYLWLCDQHQNLPRVTVLQNEASPSSASETELTEDVLLEKLNKFNEKETTNKFPKARHHKQGKRQKKQKGGKFDQKVERGDKLGEGGREVEKGRGGNEGDVTSANGSEAVVEPSVSNKGDVTSANGSEVVVEPSVSNGHEETYQQREDSVGPAGAESDGKGGKPSVRDDDTSVAHSFKEASRKPGQSGLVDREMLSVVKEKVPGAVRVRPKTAPAPSQTRPRIQRANSIAESAPYTSKACVIL
ncbi:uncharacterized protein LOC135486696 [Lineus longissimus]|uniref:uncharacterized protein LOC135486696 n=1 Tax=Lineus longissimus TaxID=88925 RepID=UPI00315C7AEE